MESLELTNEKAVSPRNFRGIRLEYQNGSPNEWGVCLI
jgi:hypothetical protein